MKFEELPDLLTAKDISKFLNISKGKAYELMRISAGAGGIPCIKIGRNVRVLKSDLIDWLKSMREVTN